MTDKQLSDNEKIQWKDTYSIRVSNNWKKKKELLPVIYDSIERQNDCYFIVKQENKFGIYNGFGKILIVPCEYDVVTPFVNNVATITKDNITQQVDTHGNIF